MTKRNVLIFVLIVALCVFAIGYIPKWQLNGKGIKDPIERIDLENELRTTVALALGGAILLVGLYLAWRRLSAAERTVELARQGQITERFTRAVDQLGASHADGSKKLEIRLGGIYSLEKIAKGSEENHWPVMEILTAYVRENAPRNERTDRRKVIIEAEGRQVQKSSPPLSVQRIPEDIQAVLTVIGRRSWTYQNGEEHRLNLSHTNLQGAFLQGANLQGAILSRTNLKEAILFKSNLIDAFLDQSNLQRANLNYANMQRGSIRRASLQKAYLMGANLQYGKLMGTVLQGAELRGADLRGANLEEANFRGANLQKAKLRGANLGSASLEGANLAGANLQGANLRIADLRETNFDGANLQGANLEGANLQGASLEGANLEGANLQGAYLRIADLGRANLERVNLERADLQKAYLERANLRKAKGLPIEQLSKVRTLYEVKLESQLKKQIKRDYPHLLQKP
jgi:uncharacterized protein YjbI with pentapeptide repeats